MKKLFLMMLWAPCLFAQAWSSILDPSRATDWSTAGFTLPNFTVACSGSPPSLASGSGNAAANAAAITAAIGTCDATHNVVNIPAGTYYTAGIDWNGKSNVVVRGAGAQTSGGTYLFDTHPGSGCNGYPTAGGCMGGNALYAQSPVAAPGVGNSVCSWTAGYSQGSSSITLNSCGHAPVVGKLMVLDQADDGVDNSGVWLCSGYDNAQTASPNGKCIQNGLGVNAAGRLLDGGGNFCNPGSGNSGNCLQYSEQQVTKITSVSGSGTGPFTVGISPPVYFNNIRVGQNPGAWGADWGSATSNVTHDGIENLTLDHSTDTTTNIGFLMIWCNQCWMQNVRSIAGTSGLLTNHVDMISSLQPVVQNNYFYGAQHLGSNSYCVQMLEDSGALVQNNIMHNTTSPDIKDAVTGSVTAYNFTPFINFGTYMQGLYASHNSGSSFNLIEGNASTSFIGDDVWGTSDLMTMFRNQLVGWQPGYTNQTNGGILNSGVRAVNVIGNVLGQPGYHNQYSVQANSTTTTQHQTLQASSPAAGAGNVSTSIYELGTTDTSGLGVCTVPPVCDANVFSTLFRWGNYDVVDASSIFNNAESSPGAVSFVNAQSTPGSHTLPSSFYLASRPSWFRSVAYPPYGPDVTSGTTGLCTGGTYDGLWMTNSSTCTGGGGTFAASSWGGHANANPAQDCYLNVMGGPPDGSGSVLDYDPVACYATSPPVITGNAGIIFAVP